jgi:hypothetical protein
MSTDVVREGNATTALNESWLRRDDETNAAYAAFCLYRDFGAERSILKVLDGAGLPSSRSGVWARWSKRFEWVKRAGAYDEHLDAIALAVREEEFRNRVREHARLARRILDVVSERLDTFDPEELAPHLMVEWIEKAARLERDALAADLGGDPTRDDEADGGQLQIAFVEDFDGL